MSNDACCRRDESPGLTIRDPKSCSLSEAITALKEYGQHKAECFADKGLTRHWGVSSQCPATKRNGSYTVNCQMVLGHGGHHRGSDGGSSEPWVMPPCTCGFSKAIDRLTLLCEEGREEVVERCVCGHRADDHGNDGTGPCGATKACRGYIHGCKQFRPIQKDGEEGREETQDKR